MRTTTHLNWEDFEKFINYIKGKDRMVCMYAMIATYCGLRVSDALQLTWGDLKKEMIVIKERKTGKTRSIPLKEDVRILADDLRPTIKRDDQHIFVNKQGGIITLQYLNRMIKKRMIECGISVEGNVSSHLFRKTFGRRVLDQGGDKEYMLILLSDVFRHSSPAITKRYLGIREEEVRSVYNLL